MDIIIIVLLSCSALGYIWCISFIIHLNQKNNLLRIAFRLSAKALEVATEKYGADIQYCVTMAKLLMKQGDNNGKRNR